MRYVSVFSGIEAASVAWEPLGWEPVAFAEIDAFPSAVLAERYPDVPNLGDITKIDWEEFINEHGRPDVVVGGSPCQSFSIAGGRESLGGESRLMFEYIRAVQDLRPRWLLWENVPGVLNTRDNAFVQLLGSLQDLGYALAWRVLDAQFFGVAQRRRRVFLVGHLGDGGAPAAVLFEPESVSGNTQTSREKREELAERSPACAGTGGWRGCLTQDGDDVSRTLSARADSSPSVEGRGPSIVIQPSVSDGDTQQGRLTPWDVQSMRVFSEGAAAPSLQAGASNSSVIQPCVVQPIAFKYSAGAAARTMPTYDDGSCNTLTADWHAPAACIPQGHAVGLYADETPKTADELPPALRFGGQGVSNLCVAFAQNARDEVRVQGDGSVSGALSAQSGTHQTTYVVMTAHTNAKGSNVSRDVAYTIDRANSNAVICVGDDNQNASVDVDLCGTLHVGGGRSVAVQAQCVNSSGDGLVGTLCAGDEKGAGSQYVNDGKLICQRVTSSRSEGGQTPT